MRRYGRRPGNSPIVPERIRHPVLVLGGTGEYGLHISLGPYRLAI